MVSGLTDAGVVRHSPASDSCIVDDLLATEVLSLSPGSLDPRHLPYPDVLLLQFRHRGKHGQHCLSDWGG